MEPRRRPRIDSRTRWAPLDDVIAQTELAGVVLTGGRYPLSAPHTVRGPAAYALLYTGPHPAYADLHAHVLYAGMSVGDIGERLSSHRSSIDRNPELELDDFAVVAVPCAGAHIAKLAEDLIIGCFDPPWCRPGSKGFGSRPQGRGRSRQHPTPWDLNFPGRADRAQHRS